MYGRWIVREWLCTIITRLCDDGLPLVGLRVLFILVMGWSVPDKRGSGGGLLRGLNRCLLELGSAVIDNWGGLCLYRWRADDMFRTGCL